MRNKPTTSVSSLPAYPRALPLTSQLTPKLHILPPAKPATRQKAASVPAISFSSSAILGLRAGDEARIMLMELIHLFVSSCAQAKRSLGSPVCQAERQDDEHV